MKKLTRSQERRISGGGPCGKKVCIIGNNQIPAGAVFTGNCSSTFGCIAPYVMFITCDGAGNPSYTFCSTGL